MISRFLRLFPKEHGAYLTLAGAATVGLWLAPRKLPALTASLAFAAAFLLRGPIERLITRGQATIGQVIAIVAISASFLLLVEGWSWLGLLVPFAGAVSRVTRTHRRIWLEAAGMGALGASAAPIACAGGARFGVAVSCAIVLAAHAALAVPIVRAELRRRERQGVGGVRSLALLGVVLVTPVVSFLGAPACALGLAPRAVHAAVSTRHGPARPARIGVRETILLVLSVALILAARRAIEP